RPWSRFGDAQDAGEAYLYLLPQVLWLLRVRRKALPGLPAVAARDEQHLVGGAAVSEVLDAVAERQQSIVVLVVERGQLVGVWVWEGAHSSVRPRNPWPVVATMSSRPPKRANSRSTGSSSQIPRR